MKGVKKVEVIVTVRRMKLKMTGKVEKKREMKVIVVMKVKVEKKKGDEGESGDHQESGDKGEEEEVEVVAKRPIAKGHSKAKPPKGKKPTDDPSTQFTGRPKNQFLLKSFNNYVTTAIWNNDRVRQAVEVVTVRKALPPGVGNRVSAVKMVDEVLKHHTLIGSSATSGTTTFTATQSQPVTSKRNATAAETGHSKPKGKKSRN
ncbi:hypothetical protein Scep_017551 [Stephania cephalantha]|uniref:Uncharacterized protein n=1 Tax=Stephania cephalantha TaxID=152367 RepID=A0AAP0IPP8_9MAGN